MVSRFSRWPPWQPFEILQTASPPKPYLTWWLLQKCDRWSVNKVFCWSGPSSWIAKWNNLSILNLYVAPMLPIKFRLNPTYCLGKDVVWRISRWTSERNNFSNSESLCRSDASHQVLAQSDLRFEGRFCLKNGRHLGYWNGMILAILNLLVAQMPPTKFGLNLT